MLIIILIVYILGALITSAIAAYQTGIEQAHLQALNPQPYQVNWVNNFFQGLMWTGHWACVIAKRRTGAVTKAEAAAYFGLPSGSTVDVSRAQ